MNTILSKLKSNQSGGAILEAIVPGDSVVSKVARVIIVAVVSMLIIEICMRIYIRVLESNETSPWILPKTKNARERQVIIQDPSKDGSITLPRSSNEDGGLEFSYSMWLFIEDWSYKYGDWKHILHKGNNTSWPLRAPGIWLHPKKNSLRVYMNTFSNPGEYTDVHNIPLNKWVHITVAVKQKQLDVFINGNLAKSHTLEGIPKQNDGDVYINAFRGFGGYISNVKYNDYYVGFSDLDANMNRGPAPIENDPKFGSKPPYFAYNWWANSK